MRTVRQCGRTRAGGSNLARVPSGRGGWWEKVPWACGPPAPGRVLAAGVTFPLVSLPTYNNCPVTFWLLHQLGGPSWQTLCPFTLIACTAPCTGLAQRKASVKDGWGRGVDRQMGLESDSLNLPLTPSLPAPFPFQLSRSSSLKSSRHLTTCI